MSPMLIRENRAKVVDYLITKEDAYDGYFYVKNPRNTFDWTVFFQPLWEEAWIGLIVFTFVTPLLISMIAFVRKLIHHQNINFLRVRNVCGSRNCFPINCF